MNCFCFIFFYVAVCCSFCRVVNTLHLRNGARQQLIITQCQMIEGNKKLAAAEAEAAVAARCCWHQQRQRQRQQQWQKNVRRRRGKNGATAKRARFFFHFISFCAIGLLTVCVERQNVSKCNQNTRTHRTHTITPIGRVCVRTKDRERKKRVRSSLVCVRCWECVCICVELNSTNDGEFNDTVSRTHAHKMVVGSACGEFERTQRNHFCLCARRRFVPERVCVCVYFRVVCACVRVYSQSCAKRQAHNNAAKQGCTLHAKAKIVLPIV